MVVLKLLSKRRQQSTKHVSSHSFDSTLRALIAAQRKTLTLKKVKARCASTLLVGAGMNTDLDALLDHLLSINLHDLAEDVASQNRGLV